MDYLPREAFMPLHAREERWACIVAHRRAGKTVACIADLVTCAIATKKKAARYAYIAPYYGQAKQVAWDYLMRLSQPVRVDSTLSDPKSVLLRNGSRITIYGADNADALRGMYLDGVVLDEYGDMRPSVWGEVIRPLLADRRGWATFIGTPKGKNHFWQVFDDSGKEDGWLRMELRASRTGLLDVDELEDARRTMTPEQYAQEFECAFDVPALGAIYRAEFTSARDSRRIGRVPYDPAIPVHTFWDLGVGDATSIWFAQLNGAEVRCIDYYEASGEGLPHYVQVLNSRGYTYGEHIAPHDIEVRELGSGKSRIEIAANLGVRFKVATRLSLEDGINAARLLFPRVWFDAERCARGLECLQNYRRDFNDRLGEFRAAPVHDWASHGADSFRYLAVSMDSLGGQFSGKLAYPKMGYA